ncbi:4'-phosphopantetheinyl transferase family protein [Streptomyces rhizoryzae]|uniref:4'-phosphopantetheinyl transferase family protein n=1 Tax=Streptomyces rhizoryzae TaxID=2932493 RepID=UPI0027E47B58|nr:4'-phosphopantetheinyl transferase superfamily protein [Streptomyces rhizoryzae]
MLAQLVPAHVAVAESHGDDPAAVLFPGEREWAAAMPPARRREFATARHCARRAALRLGAAPAPLLPGEGGAPRWPAGLVGSLTHCHGYRAAALARAAAVRAVGIDAEPHRPLPSGMLARIALPEERQDQRTLRAADPAVCWDRLLFCAKEAVYKVWSPLTGAWLGFHEASIALDPAGTFRARVLRAAPPGPDGSAPPVPAVLDGTWRATPRHLLTALVLPAPS